MRETILPFFANTPPPPPPFISHVCGCELLLHGNTRRQHWTTRRSNLNIYTVENHRHRTGRFTAVDEDELSVDGPIWHRCQINQGLRSRFPCASKVSLFIVSHQGSCRTGFFSVEEIRLVYCQINDLSHSRPPVILL